MLSEAFQVLNDWVGDPSRENEGELSDFGINLFRQEARKRGYGRNEMQAILVEESRRLRNVRADADGLKSYLRMNRSGSKYPMSRRMRIGAFLQLAAKGMLRRPPGKKSSQKMEQGMRQQFDKLAADVFRLAGVGENMAAAMAANKDLKDLDETESSSPR